MLHDRSRWWLLTVLIAAAALRLTLALVLPFDAAPDERWRFDVVSRIYATGRAPRYGQETGHHYVVKPIFGLRLNAYLARAIPGGLPLFHKLRFGSLAVSILTVLLAYAAARNLWPARPNRALALATVLAFHPQFLFIGSYLNADAYTIFANTLLLYLLTLAHRRGQLTPALAGAFGGGLGLLFLGRENGYAGFVFAAGYIGYLVWNNWRVNGRLLGLSLAIFLVFPTAFYLQQYLHYGKAFIPLVVGSGVAWVPPEWSVAQAYQSLDTAGFDYGVSHLHWSNGVEWVVFLAMIFTSSFGTFGYMDVGMPWPLYSGYLAAIVAGIVGLCRSVGVHPSAGSPAVRSLKWLLGSAAVAMATLVVVVIRHNFVVLFQAQGRYLLPLLVPAMLLFVMGWQRVFRHPGTAEVLTAFGAGFFVVSGSFTVWMLANLYA